MSASGFLNDGATAAEDFDAYDGAVTFAKIDHLFYLQLEDYGRDRQLTMTVKSKEVLRMAHWIIREFG